MATDPEIKAAKKSAADDLRTEADFLHKQLRESKGGDDHLANPHDRDYRRGVIDGLRSAADLLHEQ